MTVLVVVEVVFTTLVDVDVDWEVTVTDGDLWSVVVWITRDVTAGNVNVDFAVDISATTVVEGDG